MPNATAKALEQRLLSAFPPNQSYVPDDWETASVPSVVQSFLLHRLLEKIDEVVHNMRQEEMAWVNDNNPELETARAAFEDVLRENGQIPESAWKSMVRQASHIGVSYLVRPVPTAAAYLFEGRDKTLSVAYIAYRMQALAPYEYLRQGLDAFARHRNVQRLDAKTFRETLIRVDRILTDDYSVDRWLNTLQPLFDAAEAAYGDPGCPVRVLHAFFAHKEQTVYAERLRELPNSAHLTRSDLRAVLEGRTQKPDTFSAEDLGAVLSELDNDATDEPAPASTPPKSQENDDSILSSAQSLLDKKRRGFERPPENDQSTQEAPANPSVDDNTPQHEPSWGVPSGPQPIGSNNETNTSDSETNDPRPTPRWKQFHKSPEADTSADEANAPASNARWRQFNAKQGKSERPASSSQNAPGGEAPSSVSDRIETLEKDVMGTANPSKRDLFLRQLFNGSTDHYAEVLTKLRNANSWNDASQIIAKDVFRKNKINIYSDAAVSFTNAVEQRYR